MVANSHQAGQWLWEFPRERHWCWGQISRALMRWLAAGNHQNRRRTRMTSPDPGHRWNPHTSLSPWPLTSRRTADVSRPDSRKSCMGTTDSGPRQRLEPCKKILELLQSKRIYTKHTNLFTNIPNYLTRWHNLRDLFEICAFNISRTFCPKPKTTITRHKCILPGGQWP